MLGFLSSMVAVALLGGLAVLVTAMVAARWGDIAAVLADGAPRPGFDPDQLVLPLRFAAA